MKNINEKLKKVFESKILVGVLYGVGIVIVLGLVFCGGVSVGFHKASFGRNWGDNYYKNFGIGSRDNGPMGKIGKNMGMGFFPNSHGVNGKIIKIELPNIIVADKDNTEKIVLIKEYTKIQEMREEIKADGLKIDDFVVILGSPNDLGQIEAKFIRLMPAPEFLKDNNIITNE
ncbi:MAG: hypothetical protein WCX46_01415 [Candidatus Paceibacterota bacterium]